MILIMNTIKVWSEQFPRAEDPILLHVITGSIER